MKPYDHKEIEPKWQDEWKKTELYKTREDLAKPATGQAGRPKCYVLDMFPYPSGDGLHVGHPKGYIATDVYSRFKQMSGFNILHPMGWDAFGLPAENYAIKNKVHPRVAVEKNVKRYKEQMAIIGFNYDWSREVDTTDPEYYKWTQWIFLKLFAKGLAYESHEPINWCPSCQTGLANEDLEGGKCERCGSVVEKKPIRQWVLKITDYADRLLEDLPALNWPESIKESQKNWIGRSEGMLFTAPVKDTDLKIQTFSAHFEAFAADTFVAIAPDHPFLSTLIEGIKNKAEILAAAKNMTDKRLADKFGAGKEMEGIFTGLYIVDPVGNGDLPIWVASFALADYGTGIVKCSAHDERDFAFAKKYNLKLKPVLFPADKVEREKVEKLEVCYFDMKKGVLTEPAEFSGKLGGESRQEIIKYLEDNKLAEKKITYRLNDWVFSRQRYWGEPIPLVHCENCGVVPVPEADLPVRLPEVEHYEPTGTGESPLANITDWVNTTCPKCGGPGKRETNTMPQWAGSSWYYLRFIDPQNKEALVDKAKEKYWSPVDFYVGGAEHATRHLIYARFWHKFLFDLGMVNYSEPFTRLQNVGLILAADGRKMSKRWGNVINPDDIINLYGADTLRLYEMFMGPFDQDIAWSTESMIGPRRFIEKVWRLREKVNSAIALPSLRGLPVRPGHPGGRHESQNSLSRSINQTIKKVGEDIENFRFNTAISTLMILVNEMEKAETISQENYEILLKLIAPFAPHVAEELWRELGNSDSIHLVAWPAVDQSKLVSSQARVTIQVNSRVRGVIEVDRDATEERVLAQAKSLDSIKKWLGDNPIKRVVFVSNKLLNILI